MSQDSKKAVQMTIRIPESLKVEMEREAKREERSLNSHVIATLKRRNKAA